MRLSLFFCVAIALTSVSICSESVAQQGPIFAPDTNIVTSPIWYANPGASGLIAPQTQPQPQYYTQPTGGSVPRVQYAAPLVEVQPTQYFQPAPFIDLATERPWESPLAGVAGQQSVIDYPIYDSPIVVAGYESAGVPFEWYGQHETYDESYDEFTGGPFINGSVVGETPLVDELLEMENIAPQPQEEIAEAESVMESPSDVTPEMLAEQAAMDPNDQKDVPMINGEIERLENKIDSNHETINQRLESLNQSIELAGGKTSAQIIELSRAVKSLSAEAKNAEGGEAEGEDFADEIAEMQKQLRNIAKTASAKQRATATQIRELEGRVAELQAAKERAGANPKRVADAEARAREKKEKAEAKAKAKAQRDAELAAAAAKREAAKRAEAKKAEAAKAKARRDAERAAAEAKREEAKKQAAKKAAAKKAEAAKAKARMEAERAAAERAAAKRAEAAKAAKDKARRDAERAAAEAKRVEAKKKAAKKAEADKARARRLAARAAAAEAKRAEAEKAEKAKKKAEGEDKKAEPERRGNRRRRNRDEDRDSDRDDDDDE